nr:AAA family ATPase [Bradyrhizobium sp. 137]
MRLTRSRIEPLDSRNKDYWLPIVADLLTRFDDGTSSARRGVILIGATNNPESVDPALLRPGRFERIIKIERADAAGTLSMLKFHVAGAVPDDELDDIATAMERSTGAEVMAFVREARRIARHAGRELLAADLRAALLSSERPPPEMDWRICAHEAGHVLLALVLECGVLRHCIVGARSGAENRTLVEYASSPDLATRQTVEDRTTMLLGGRAAERVLFGCNSAGGSGDESSDAAMSTETEKRRTLGSLRPSVVKIVRATGGGPIRTILERGHRKPTGVFTSRKNRREFPWEAIDERHFMWISEVDYRVTSFLVQPFRMEFHFADGGRMDYFPDMERRLGPIRMFDE